MHMLTIELERQTTLESDLDLLNSKIIELPGNQRMAVVYRSERKKVVRNHFQLGKWMVSILKKVNDIEGNENDI